jgi:hypothetical protein
MFEEENAQWGLVHALVLDGKGGARSIARTELDDLQLQPQEACGCTGIAAIRKPRPGCAKPVA